MSHGECFVSPVGHGNYLVRLAQEVQAKRTSKSAYQP